MTSVPQPIGGDVRLALYRAVNKWWCRLQIGACRNKDRRPSCKAVSLSPTQRRGIEVSAIIHYTCKIICVTYIDYVYSS